MIAMPASADSAPRLARKACPKIDAVAPMVTNTVEKPSTKRNAAKVTSRRARFAPPSASSSTVVPAIYVR